MNKTDKIWYKALIFLSKLTTKETEKLKKEEPSYYKKNVPEDIENTLHQFGYIQFNTKISRAITQSGLQQLRDLERIKNEDINRRVNLTLAIITTITLVVTIIAVQSSYISSSIANNLAKRVVDLTPSKYADINAGLSQFSGDYAEYSLSQITQDKILKRDSQLGFNIINTGQLNTGNISIAMYYPKYNDTSVYFYPNYDVGDIESKNNKAFWLNFTITKEHNPIGLHYIPLRIICPNCKEQGVAINREIYLCIYNESGSVTNISNAKRDCGIDFLW